MKKNFRSILFLILFCHCLLFAQERSVQNIIIVSTWGGLGSAGKSELSISRKGDSFYAKGNKIEANRVLELVRAIESPKIEKFNAANLGITQEWLDQNADVSAETFWDFSNAALNQKELYLSTFRDLNFVESSIPSVLSGGWTDDYPTVRIVLEYSDGSKIELSTDEQPAFMLPWKVVKNKIAFETYNANISKTAADLLPKTSTNKERLSGDNLRRVLADFVRRHIKEDWERLEVENRAGNALDIIKRDYEVISASINPYHGLDFGDEWGKNKNPRQHMDLILKKNEFPKNFAISLKLPFIDDKVDNLSDFQTKIKKYQSLVLSVPWLKEYMNNGRDIVELRFVMDRSFSEKAMERFREDMTAIGKQELVLEVEKSQNEAALIGVGGGLEYYQSYWIVLPDGRVILWRYRYPRLMNWSEQKMETNNCTDEISAGLKCVGSVISHEGTLSR